jgi:hypothetical protein
MKVLQQKSWAFVLLSYNHQSVTIYSYLIISTRFKLADAWITKFCLCFDYLIAKGLVAAPLQHQRLEVRCLHVSYIVAFLVWASSWFYSIIKLWTIFFAKLSYAEKLYASFANCIVNMRIIWFTFDLPFSDYSGQIMMCLLNFWRSKITTEKPRWETRLLTIKHVNFLLVLNVPFPARVVFG